MPSARQKRSSVYTLKPMRASFDAVRASIRLSRGASLAAQRRVSFKPTPAEVAAAELADTDDPAPPVGLTRLVPSLSEILTTAAARPPAPRFRTDSNVSFASDVDCPTAVPHRTLRIELMRVDHVPEDTHGGPAGGLVATLRPGDVLFIPAGWWHETIALEGGGKGGRDGVVGVNFWSTRLRCAEDGDSASPSTPPREDASATADACRLLDLQRLEERLVATCGGLIAALASALRARDDASAASFHLGEAPPTFPHPPFSLSAVEGHGNPYPLSHHPRRTVRGLRLRSG